MNSRINEEAYYNEVKKWNKHVTNEMRQNVRVKTNNKLARQRLYSKYERGEKILRKSIRYKIYNQHGLPEQISIPFAKHGFFLQVGAGRGHPYKTNPRKKVDWYDTVMDDEIPNLADTVMYYTGNRAMKYAALDPQKRRNI